MRPSFTPAGEDDHVREFVETLLRTGLMLGDLLSGLLDDLPDDAFGGEPPAEVLLEMLIGTIRPVARAAGEQTVQGATRLLVATGDKTLSDMRAATALAGRGWARA